MPLLSDYRCDKCRVVEEHFAGPEDAPTCPVCHKTMEKVFPCPKFFYTLGQKVEKFRGHLKNYRRDKNLKY